MTGRARCPPFGSIQNLKDVIPKVTEQQVGDGGGEESLNGGLDALTGSTDANTLEPFLPQNT